LRAGTQLLSDDRDVIRAFLAASAGHEPREALSALCTSIASHLKVPTPLWLGAAADVDITEITARPDVLSQCFEATLDAGRRRRTGSHFTPEQTAVGLVQAVFSLRESSPSGAICDPTVGGGVFLLAALRALVADGRDPAEAAGQLWGADIDPLAADVARSVLELEVGAPISNIEQRVVVGDSLLGAPWEEPPLLEVLIGNPPFLSQLRGTGIRSSDENAMLAERLGVPIPPYAETAMLFAVLGMELCAEGATVALILPQSILSARDNGPLRHALTDRGAISGLWFSAEPVFSASVAVCAPMFTLGSDLIPTIERWVGPGVAKAPSAVAPASTDNWADLVTDLLGVPPVELSTDAVLGDIAHATAGFRDEFYGIAAVAEESADGISSSPIVTSGLIDPLTNLWGTRAAKLGGKRYQAPVVPTGSLDQLEPRVKRWVEARLVPKVVVATQTRVIEAMLDLDGAVVPVTPVVSVEADPKRLVMIAATLSSPPIAAWAIRRAFGTALAVDAVKLSAKQILEVPLPEAGGALDTAMNLVAQLQAGIDRELWADFGTRMCEAFAVPAQDLVPWWLDRMRWTTEGTGHD
jgi:hypothetical protein